MSVASKTDEDAIVDFGKLVQTMKDEGEELILARPGISVMLFYDTPVGKLGGTIAAILKDYLAFIAPHSMEKYYGGSTYKKLTPKVINSTFDELRALEEDDEFLEFHFGPGYDPGLGYAVHFKGSALADDEDLPNETNLLTLEFPPTFLTTKKPDEFIDFVVRNADRQKFHSGIAGYAFQHPVMVLREEALEAIAKAAMRYRGFDISNDDIRDDLKGHIYSVSWLNLLSSRMVKELGGLDKLRRALPKGGSLVEMKHGVLVRLAPLPIIGDVNQGGADLKPLKDFAKIVKPLRVQVDYLGSDDDLFAEKWLSRFD
jgi:hypothetical protein